jgi:hypothetical protein
VGQGSAGGIAPIRLVAVRKVVAAIVGSGRDNWNAMSPAMSAAARTRARVIARIRRCCPSSRMASPFTAIE